MTAPTAREVLESILQPGTSAFIAAQTGERMNYHKVRLDQALAAMEAYASRLVEDARREGWQPIETAPRDGNQVLLYSPRMEPPVGVGWYDSQQFIPDGDEIWGWGQIEADGMMSMAHPTHWRPLPDAPERDGGEA